MDAGNSGAGVHNVTLDVGSDGMGVRGIVVSSRSSGIRVCCKFPLEVDS